MRVHKINDLSDTAVITLLQTELRSVNDSKIIKNYHPDYSGNPGNLFKILAEGRYNKDHGCYYVAEHQGQYIASAGWNRYEHDHTVALLLTRAYTVPRFRAQWILAKYFLKTMIANTTNYRHRWITVNDYNMKIYNWFSRVSNNHKNTYSYWPEIYKKFHAIGERDIYSTKQFVLEYKEQV